MQNSYIDRFKTFIKSLDGLKEAKNDEYIPLFEKFKEKVNLCLDIYS